LRSAIAGLPVADLHNDLLTAVLHQRERSVVDGFGGFWLPQLRQGGLVLQVLPFFTEEQYVGEGALRRCLRALDLARRLAAEHPGEVAIVESADDLSHARRGERIGLLLALEGLEPVGHDIEILRTLHALGVRMASLTWNRRTMFADGQEQHTAGGRLTMLGVEAVAEMERLGMVLDVSHLSDAGFWHVHEIATRPYVASHSSCRALLDSRRNLSDDQLRALADKGGVVGINFWGRFIGERPSVDCAIDHVAHAVEVAGADHVALGPDFMYDYARTVDPILGGSVTGSLEEMTPAGLRRPDELPQFTARLVERLGADVARKVASDNAIRVISEVLR
jgi:membrane dipeptidase